ncbi:hypothetical protein XELAEV_18033478mg [Xenopus laevis]|uniref:Uncharacterized protein n=1 Tax=Xenopus laevis TaxID=8355 RepID=A0A974CJE2_XENLA|nr:hypothetical protein XELAEV_18033478mg [Xenopus laevis]
MLMGPGRGALRVGPLTERICYHPVKIPKTLNLIYKLNYLLLLHTTRGDCNKWQKLELSWLGRLATTKMTILPQIIYLLRTLQMSIPPTSLKGL